MVTYWTWGGGGGEGAMMDRKGLVQKNTLQIFDLQRLVSLIAASMYVLCPTFRIKRLSIQ